MRKKIKMEIILAVTLAISLSILVIYLSQPKDGTYQYALLQVYSRKPFGNLIQAMLKKLLRKTLLETQKGFFETVIEDIRNLDILLWGRMPYLT